MANSQDFKKIKKHFGEKMAQFCRSSFPTILENEGLLPELLIKHFGENRFLFNDIVDEGVENQFVDYINNSFEKSNDFFIKPQKDIYQLMDEVDYELVECKTVEDVQQFRKYYSRGEALCTFNNISGRLNSHHVFFAVKKNIDKIKRENFNKPRREDDYGISCISLQFTKNKNSSLSIKNRYNHTVVNFDATYGNNLENIIPGLTLAFEENLKLSLKRIKVFNFELNNYVFDNKGVYHKGNCEINNIWYLANNKILKNGEIIDFDKSDYIVADYFVICKNKEKGLSVKMFDESVKDSFTDAFENIKQINEIKDKNELGNEIKRIVITLDNEENVEIHLNNRNQIVGYVNKNLHKVGDNFMHSNNARTQLDLPALERIGNNFMCRNKKLTQLDLPSLEQVGYDFLGGNETLKQIDLPRLEQVGDNFLHNNEGLIKLDLPALERIGNDFMCCNKKLTQLDLPNLKQTGNSFLSQNNSLTQLNLPVLEQVGNKFLHDNEGLIKLDLPSLEQTGDNFLHDNEGLIKLDLPSLEQVGYDFLAGNETLKQIDLPRLEQVGNRFLLNNKALTQLNLPVLEQVGYDFLAGNETLKQIDLPRLEQVGNRFLLNNKALTQLNLPVLEQVGDSFLCNNEGLIKLDLPSLEQVGDDFLAGNETLKQIDLPRLEQVGNRFLHYNEDLIKLDLPALKQKGAKFLENNSEMRNKIMTMLDKQK